jgi:hypothetical protein
VISVKIVDWEISINNQIYKIEFIPNIFFKFRFKILINNEIKKEIKYKLDRKGADYNFEIEGHECSVILRVNNMKSKYDLTVDGISVTTLKPMKLLS